MASINSLLILADSCFVECYTKCFCGSFEKMNKSKNKNEPQKYKLFRDELPSEPVFKGWLFNGIMFESDTLFVIKL